MFVDQIAAAIDAAELTQLDSLGRRLWQAHAAGHLTDGQAQSLAEVLRARQMDAKAPRSLANGLRAIAGIFTPRKPQRVPKRPEVLQRRRRLAAAGPLPPSLAGAFTLAEQAVMRIIGNEIRQRGKCALFLDQIAARAGCSRSTVQRALRAAARLGVVTVQERRRRGHKSLTNIVRAVCALWKDWLAKTSHSRGDRVSNSKPDRYKNSNSLFESAGTAVLRGDKPRSGPVAALKTDFRWEKGAELSLKAG